MTSVLFFGKKDSPHCALAVEFIKRHFSDYSIYRMRRGDRFPEETNWCRPDYIISYLSPWIIPGYLLDRARVASINFHPGPPEYPGIGCTNFAIYDEADTFGVTCHHMAPEVDTGAIIAVKRFSLYNNDTVLSLTQRCYTHIHAMFYDIMDSILGNSELPQSAEFWTRRPYTRAELNELCRTPDMPDEEVRRRIRATTYPGAQGAYMEAGGARFEYNE